MNRVKDVLLVIGFGMVLAIDYWLTWWWGRAPVAYMEKGELGWEIHRANGQEHCVPRDDLRPHDLSLDCWCHPRPDADADMVVIHHSMDNRESYEAGLVQ